MRNLCLVFALLFEVVAGYGRDRELRADGLMASAVEQESIVKGVAGAPGGGGLAVAGRSDSRSSGESCALNVMCKAGARAEGDVVYAGELANDKLRYALYRSQDGAIGTAILLGWLDSNDYYTHLNVPDEVVCDGVKYSVRAIDNYAFSFGWGIEGLTLGRNVQIIGQGAFQQCNISEISFPKSVETIGGNSFLKNPLNRITFEDPSASAPALVIGAQAFDYCNGTMRTFELPARISAGDGSFLASYQNFMANCESLESITLNGAYEKNNGKGFEIKDGVLCYISGTGESQNTMLCCLPMNSPTTVFTLDSPRIDVMQNAMTSKKLKSVTLNATAPRRDGKVNVVIDNYAFDKCEALTELSISANGPITMSPLCAKGCLSLKEYKLGESVSNLKVFGGVIYARKDGHKYLVNYPNGKSDASFAVDGNVEYIGDEAFSSNPFIKGMELPSGLMGIGNNAFRDCPQLSSVKYTGNILNGIGSFAFAGTALVANSSDGFVKWNGWIVAYKGTVPETVIFPSDVSRVAAGVFSGRYEIKKAVFPARMERIPSGLFQSCTNLTEVVWPENLVEIQPYAFANCDLREIHLPATARRILLRAFYNNEGAESIRIGDFTAEGPAAVAFETGIAADAFARALSCASLKIGRGFEKIGDGAFMECGLWAAMEQSRSADDENELNIPEGVISVGEQAFWAAGNIGVLSLPSTLEAVGVYAFYLSDAPRQVRINRRTPPAMLPQKDTSLTPCVFNPKMLTTSTLIFPAGTDPASFFSDANWNFAHYEEGEFTAIRDTESDGLQLVINGLSVTSPDGKTMSLYDMNGRLISSGIKVEASTGGIYLLATGGKVYKIVL